MKDETMAWLSYADENLDVARLTLEHGHLNASLQNAQQAVEKYLKAVIIEKDLEFRRTHSIRELTGLLSGAGITADISDDEIDLIPGQYDRDIRFAFGSWDVLDFAELLFKDMSENEEQSVERLVLR